MVKVAGGSFVKYREKGENHYGGYKGRHNEEGQKNCLEIERHRLEGVVSVCAQIIAVVGCLNDNGNRLQNKQACKNEKADNSESAKAFNEYAL